jgi:4-amino-4-deoxy-L-arabinose transferase-like glycosyltransferase
MFATASNTVPWTGWAALGLAVFVYFFALGSPNAATNGDELLYAQITRTTAATGNLLPLQSEVERHRNTKPPALFWQGIASTDWAKNYELWRLRYPSVLYTMGIAVMVFFLGRKLGGSASEGLLAALIYLCFFGTYRYGRVFLTSAPETFWLFLPLCLLLLPARPIAPIGWGRAAAFGLMIGVALLYKSFALVVPAIAGLAWWTAHQRGYRAGTWLKSDAPQIALAGLVSLAVFSLWYVLDPQRHLILADFVLDENMGKFDSEGESYLANLLWGGSSIWRNVVSYPINAGLLAPAIVAVFVLAFRDRGKMHIEEKLLWFWIIALFAVFSLPNQRDERYLLPGMPALAVLCALYWRRIPVWLLGISLAAVLIIALGMALGAMLLTGKLGDGAIYPWLFWAFMAALSSFAAATLVRRTTIRSAILPAILLLYLAFGLFLLPFDGPLGTYGEEARSFARGKTIAVPVNFGAREEIYRFLLPGSDPQPYKIRKFTGIENLALANTAFIVSTRLDEDPLREHRGLRLVGVRLQLVDRFDGKETAEMLRGNVAPYLFKKDLLVEVLP